MAYITRNWLEGEPERARGHFPVKVALELSQARDDDPWSSGRNICFYVRATQDDGNYQLLYLNTSDVNRLIKAIAPVVTHGRLTEVAITALRNLGDAELLNVFAELLATRQKK